MENDTLLIPELKAQVPTSQVCALEAAATILGRTWKSQLREMWMSGNYGVLEGHSADLQNFRNASYGGPAGLNKYIANQTYRQEIQNRRDLEAQEANKPNGQKCEECDAPLCGLELKLCPECRPENEGSLSDMECPKCGQQDRFQIAFAGSADVNDEGSDDDGDHEWDENSSCQCSECSNSMGVVKDFTRGTPSFNLLRKEELDRRAGKPEVEKEYIVTLARTLPQYKEVRVKAKNSEEAEKLALERAGDQDFGSGTTGGEAEYTAEGIRPA